MNPVSIFNDVIGPVMRGPSSSHCAAALRIGRLARDLMDGDISSVLIEFDREGSLPTTHDSQGSDMGLFGGLLGWEADDERLPHSMQTFEESGMLQHIVTVDVGDPHPNTYRLTLTNAREKHSVIAISTGGGMMEVHSIDGISLHMDGGYHETLLWVDPATELSFEGLEVITHAAGEQKLLQVRGDHFPEVPAGVAAMVKRLSPVLPVPSRKEIQLPFTSCAEMLEWDGDKKTPVWKLAVAYEMARGNFTETEVIERMKNIVRILRRSIVNGIAGTSYEDRVLHHQSGRFAELMKAGRLLNGGALNRIVLYVNALMEVKSSMGVIVAAPTAGACAALPGAVIAMAEEMNLDEEAMAKAMLAAGLIGVFIATRWTFAAEVGGCQAEGGSAACMAAASMSFQSMLGLICDPIANRVEAPCLGKNVMAASNALSCANMALADFDPLIPLDEVIDAAKHVSTMMPREHRCTSLGGLAISPTSLEIERKLASLKNKGCGSCACH
jgi:L-serine dehydratase